MWRGTCVYETSKDRFILETADQSATQDGATANRRVFVEGLGARIITANPLSKASGAVANPAIVPRTKAIRTDPLRYDLRADTRPVTHDLLALPDGPAPLAAQLFDAALDAATPSLQHPGVDAAPTEVFALIDAALDPMMPDMLTGSGLDHVCLFAGKAEQELAEVAPWLVRLTPDHPLTAALLDPSEPPVGLWPLQGAIFLCSRIGMPALRRNLRNFTRLEGEEGAAPTYFRFYAASVFRSFLQASEPAVLQHLLAGIDRAILPGDASGNQAMVVNRCA